MGIMVYSLLWSCRILSINRIIIRHLLFRVPQKGTIVLTASHVSLTHDEELPEAQEV